MQGAPCGTQSWVSRITPWAEGDVKPLSHRGCPDTLNNNTFSRYYVGYMFISAKGLIFIAEQIGGVATLPIQE